MEVTLAEQTDARQTAERVLKQAKESLEAEVSMHAKTKQVHNRSLAANKEPRQGLAALKAEHKAQIMRGLQHTEQSAEVEKLRTQAKHLQQKVSMLRQRTQHWRKKTTQLTLLPQRHRLRH